MIPRVRAIVAAGMPVVGHVGLLPQSVVTPEGYRAQGRDVEQALRIIADSIALEAAGCAALVVEAVPAAVAALITAARRHPGDRHRGGVGGRRAGARLPRPARPRRGTRGEVRAALRRGPRVLEDGARRWADDVRAGRYPAESHTYAIAPEALAAISERLGRV